MKKLIVILAMILPLMGLSQTPSFVINTDSYQWDNPSIAVDDAGEDIRLAVKWVCYGNELTRYSNTAETVYAITSRNFESEDDVERLYMYYTNVANGNTGCFTIVFMDSYNMAFFVDTVSEESRLLYHITLMQQRGGKYEIFD